MQLRGARAWGGSARSMILSLPARLVLLVLLAHSLVAGAEVGVALRFGPDGLASISWHGDEYLQSGVLGATWNDSVELRGGDGSVVAGDMKQGVLSVDAAAQAVVRRFPWGTLHCAYAASGDQLALELTISNSGERTISALQLQLLELVLPSAAAEYDGNTPMIATNIGSPSVLTLSHAHGVLALVNQDIERGLSFGCPWANDRPASRRFPLWADTGRRAALPTSHPTIVRPISPGGSDQYHVTLRFGPVGATAGILAGDLLQRFASAHPPTLAWPDRRPIGMLMLSSSVPHHAANPRGWFLNAPEIDTTSEQGRARFAERLMAYADKSVEVLRRMGAQGVIVWDCEGQEFPHATSYIGDPRCLPPEMVPLIDAFFAKFSAAGLKTGLCIRPQRAVLPVYGATAMQLEVPVADQQAVLAEKVGYASKRWGCSLYYVDSNVDRRHGAEGAMAAEVFRGLAAAFPAVLLIPEQKTPDYWASCAPYSELRGGWTTTPGLARQLYPKAFSVLCVNDGALASRHGELVAAVARGDVLLFRAWWDDPEQAAVSAIYREAGH
jgi:hypothetical protein